MNVYEGVSTGVQAYIERNGKHVQSGSVVIPATGEIGKVKLVIPVQEFSHSAIRRLIEKICDKGGT